MRINSIRSTVDGKCFNSKWELKVYTILKRLLPEKYFPILVNQNIPGCSFQLDIYIPKLKIAFELQGPRHMFELRTIRNDFLKASICKRIGIKLFHVLYNKPYGRKYFSDIINKNGNCRR